MDAATRQQVIDGAIAQMERAYIFADVAGKMADALTRRQWHLLSHLSAHFLDVLQGLPTLKLLGRSRRQAATMKNSKASPSRTSPAIIGIVTMNRPSRSV